MGATLLAPLLEMAACARRLTCFVCTGSWRWLPGAKLRCQPRHLLPAMSALCANTLWQRFRPSPSVPCRCFAVTALLLPSNLGFVAPLRATATALAADGRVQHAALVQLVRGRR